jgi:S1-C subfamily serine protease
VGLGTVVSSDGLIVTGDVFADERGRYLVTFDNTKFYDVSVLPKKPDNQFYFLKIIQTDKKNPVVFTPVVLADSNNLKLGQTVIAWGGQEQNAVSTGIISSLFKSNDSALASSTTEIAGLNTNINSQDSLSGGPLLNLSGEVVGIKISSNLSTKYSFLASNLLRQELTSVSSL